MSLKIIFVSEPNTAQGLLTEAQVRFYHTDDVIETIDATDKTNLAANIAALTASQDYLHVCGNVADEGDFLTDAELVSIKAKLTDDSNVSTYTITDQSTTVNAAYQCWNELFAVPAPPLVIYYTSALDSDLTATEELYGDYLDLSIVARYFGEMLVTASLNALLGLIDQGFVAGSPIRKADGTNASHPQTNQILLTELLQTGLDISNYVGDTASGKDFLYFEIDVDDTAFVGVIDKAAKTVISAVPFGTTITALISTFTVSDGAAAYVIDALQVSGTTSLNYTGGKTVTVVAADGTLKTYALSVTLDGGSSANDFLTYTYPEISATEVIIDTDAHTVTAEVVFGTSLTSLVAEFTVSDGAYSVLIEAAPQVSETTVNNFTNPVTYKIKSQSGVEQEWVITTTVAAY